MSIEKVQRLFEDIDKDHSGEIDADEIEHFFEICGTPVNRETAEALLREADIDKSGTIGKEGKKRHR